jgi:hypothetical protein
MVVKPRMEAFVMRIRILAAASFAVALIVAPGAGADPTQHFSDSFPITCGGHTYLLVSKLGASQIISIDGQPSNSVSILFGITVVDNSTGAVLFESHKPSLDHQQYTTCVDRSVPGITSTAQTLVTPRG